MATTATRWNFEVAAETDSDLRQFLAAEGDDPDAGFARFVEDAVKERIFELTVQRAKARNAGRSAEEIQTLVDDAVEWARGR